MHPPDNEKTITDNLKRCCSDPEGFCLNIPDTCPYMNRGWECSFHTYSYYEANYHWDNFRSIRRATQPSLIRPPRI